MNLGLPEILLILLLVLLLFGAKRLPDVARSVGRSMRILKSETQAMGDDRGDAAKPASSSPSELGAGAPEAAEPKGDATTGPEDPEPLRGGEQR